MPRRPNTRRPPADPPPAAGTKPARQRHGTPADPPPARAELSLKRPTRPAKEPAAPAGAGPADPPPAPPAELALPKPTEHGRAVEQLLRWIAKGASPIEQAEALEAHFPTADPQAVYQDAVAHVLRLAEPGPALVRGFAFVSAQELYRRAVESGDLAAALRTLKFLTELGSLAPLAPADEDPAITPPPV